jgi:hypothetical protein
MSSFSLASYTIRAKEQVSHSNIRINNLRGGGDVFVTFRDYLNKLRLNSSVDEADQKMMRVSKLTVSGRTLRGIIETGEYGYESELYDINTDAVSHRRRNTEAEMLPFYFLISLPTDVNEGVIILQRFRQFGIRKILLGDFGQHFSVAHPSYRVEFNPLTYENLLNEYLDGGQLKAVRLVKFNMPTDIATAFDLQDHLEEEAYVELVVRSRRNKALQGMLDKIKGALGVGSRRHLDGVEWNKLLEIPDFDFNTIKAELEINGKRKVIDLTNPYRLRSYYDVTENVDIAENGHPIFKSINSLAEELLEKLEESLRRNR